MDQPDDKSDRDALMVQIERNRIQMKIAWLKAEGLDGAMQSLSETVENAKSRLFTRKKKSG